MSRPPLPPLESEPDSSLSGLEITVLNEQTDVDIDTSLWLSLASKVLIAEGVGVNAPSGVEVSLLFVDEASIATLNQQFMGKVGPTDVLSFPIDPQAGEARNFTGPASFDEDGFPVLALREGDLDDLDSGSSFASGQGHRDSRFDDGPDHDDMPLLLGDIVVCPAYAARALMERATFASADEEQREPRETNDLHDGSINDELALLVVHGILHLLGMDHMIDSEAEEMEVREREHLRRSYVPMKPAPSREGAS
jgi:probable rRNA maturation factor